MVRFLFEHIVIKSQFMDIGESVKYVFREGRCIVRALPVPSEEGEFSFVVAHSRYPDLQLTLKVLVELPYDMEPLSVTDNVNVLALRESETQADYMSSQHHSTAIVEANIESSLAFQTDLWNEILAIGLRIGELEKEIKLLESHQQTINVNLSKFTDIRNRMVNTGTYGSPGKDAIKAQIKSKPNCAAALLIDLMNIMRNDDHHGLLGHIIGIIALMGTTPTLELSRLFAEYLGDEMLAVVCKSYEDICLLEGYGTNGKLNPNHALHMLARELGQPINSRFLVLFIEDIRPCTVEKDVEGKLLLPDPVLPDGSTPAGFLGSAVNMINIDVDHMYTETNSGHGLRETLFYRLFGEAQVYKTRDDMKRAVSCIKDGALSLDGGILRGNGAASLGCVEPDIIFPVVPENGMLRGLERYQELKMEMSKTIGELVKKRKAHGSELKRFKKRRDLYVKYFTQGPGPSNTMTPDSCLDEKPVTTPTPASNKSTTRLDHVHPVPGPSNIMTPVFCLDEKPVITPTPASNQSTPRLDHV